MNEDTGTPSWYGFFAVVADYQDPVVVRDIHGFCALPIHKADLVAVYNTIVKARLGVVDGHCVGSDDLRSKALISWRLDAGSKPELANGKDSCGCFAVPFHFRGPLTGSDRVFSKAPGEARSSQLHRSRKLRAFNPALLLSLIAPKGCFRSVPVGRDHD